MSRAPAPPDRPDNAAGSPQLHLQSADFDAYLPERAASNAFTRPRLELKQRMMAWARTVVARLAELGVSVEVTGSDEHPSLRNGRRVDHQRVFFWRDAAARAELERLLDQKRSLAERLGDPAPHKSHAYLALKLDTEGVEVSIELYPEAWVDVRNLRARLADPSRALELTSALEVLPEQFSIGLSAQAAPRAQAAGATTDEIRTLLDHLPEASHDAPALWLGWSVPRDVAIAHSELLDEQLQDAIVALGPVFKLIAWAPDNDLLVLHREWDAAKAERARVHEQAERERAEWEARREGERRPPAARSKDRDDDARERYPVPSAPAGERASGPASSGSGAPPPSRPPPARTFAKGQPRPVARRQPVVTSIDASAPIEKGTRVEVLDGPFAGKVGVVQELDGKGGARVMLGLLAMRLDVKDLAASVEGRPVLSSSHRKPLPARS